MKLKIGGKKYEIKFAYKPTLKERIISRFVKIGNEVSDNDGELDFDKFEDLLLFLPEVLLVGLQKNYEEFRYDYDTGEGKDDKLEKAFEIVEEYMDGDDADAMEFFYQLKEALMEDSFLRGLFQKEQKKQGETEGKESLEEQTAERTEN